jgi:hypothetical protein
MKTPKYFYRVTETGEPVPGTLARLKGKPDTGKWVEVKAVCCTPAPLTFRQTTITLTDPTNSCNFIASSTYATNPEEDPTFQHFIKFVGQDAQGDFTVNIPIKPAASGVGTYIVDDSKTIDIPSTASGSYKAILYFVQSPAGDYPSVTILDASDADLSGLLSAGNAPSSLSTAFDIADVAKFAFSPSCSG